MASFWADVRDDADSGFEMMVYYSGAENQSLPVRKNVQLGDSSPDALSQQSTLCKPVEAS